MPARPAINRSHHRCTTSHNISNEMISKMQAVVVSSDLRETRLDNHRPTSTPKRLVNTSANPAPKNTTQGDRDSALISKVVT